MAGMMTTNAEYNSLMHINEQDDHTSSYETMHLRDFDEGSYEDTRLGTTVESYWNGKSDPEKREASLKGSRPRFDKWRHRARIFLPVPFAITIFFLVLHYSRPTTDLASQSGFQPGSGQRSTMSIVFACLSTMIICIVSAIHFDIPENLTHRLSFSKKVLSIAYWSAFLGKVFLWTTGLLMPEMVVAWACTEYLLASKDVAYMRKEGYTKWTFQHAFFARMGGLKLKNGVIAVSGRDLMSKLEDRAHLTDIDIESLGYDIADRSKKDILAKALAILQITRFLAETVARVFDSLPISPLEYVTCAHVVCAWTMFAFWLHKPHGVEECIHLDKQSAPTFGEEQNDRKDIEEYIFNAETIPDVDDKETLIAVTVAMSAALILGAGHLASWNEQFEVANGQTLWRVCSLSVTVIPTIPPAVIFVENRRYLPKMFCGIIFTIAVAIYVIARNILILLLVYSFFSMPSGVYDTGNTDWLYFIPFLH